MFSRAVVCTSRSTWQGASINSVARLTLDRRRCRWSRAYVLSWTEGAKICDIMSRNWWAPCPSPPPPTLPPCRRRSYIAPRVMLASTHRDLVRIRKFPSIDLTTSSRDTEFMSGPTGHLLFLTTMHHIFRSDIFMRRALPHWNGTRFLGYANVWLKTKSRKRRYLSHTWTKASCCIDFEPTRCAPNVKEAEY